MDDPPLLSALATAGVLVLDGAMATELERRGADLTGGLWSARVLLDQPELVRHVHHDYFAAGADVATTASYQASVPGFVAAGLDHDRAAELLRRSVRLAVAARDHFWATHRRAEPGSTRVRPVVATSVGPYGAVLADGSEYRGDYRVITADLVRFHRQRLQVLVEAGVEVLACETIPSRQEAEALVEVLADWPRLTAWVSFSARDGGRVGDGTPLADCARFLHEQPQVVAVGVNCTAGEHVTPLLRRLADVTDKPAVVYPNSGESWDAATQHWTGRPTHGWEAMAREWYAAGARLVGGCCRTGPAEIAAVARAARTAHIAG